MRYRFVDTDAYWLEQSSVQDIFVSQYSASWMGILCSMDPSVHIPISCALKALYHLNQTDSSHDAYYFELDYPGRLDVCVFHNVQYDAFQDYHGNPSGYCSTPGDLDFTSSLYGYL